MNTISEAIPNILSALPVAAGAILPTSSKAGGFASTLAAIQQVSSVEPRSSSGAQFATASSPSAGIARASNASVSDVTMGQSKKFGTASSPSQKTGNAPTALPALPISQPIPLAPSEVVLPLGNEAIRAPQTSTIAPANKEILNSGGIGTIAGISTNSVVHAPAVTIAEEGASGKANALAAGEEARLDGTPTAQLSAAVASVAPKAVPQSAPQPLFTLQLQRASSDQTSGAASDPATGTNPTVEPASNAESTQPLVPGETTIRSTAVELSPQTPPTSTPSSSPGETPSLVVSAVSSISRLSSSDSNSPPILLASSALAPPVAEWYPQPTADGSDTKATTPVAANDNLVSAVAVAENADAQPSVPPNTTQILPQVLSAAVASPPASTPAASSARTSNSVTTVVTNPQRESTSIDVATLPAPTAFSVFFSESGGGAESAASVLPKMIFPAANVAAHTASSILPTRTGNVPESTASSSLASNLGTQQLKVAQPSSQQENLPLRRDAGASLSNPSSSVTGPSTGSSPNSPAPSPTTPLAAVSVPAAAPANISTALMPVTTSPAVTADTASKQSATDSGSANVLPPVPQAQPVAPPGPVQMAQMVSKVSQSEMRIGLNTSAFGSVEVRTTVRSADVGLVIGSEKGDLRGLLTNEMPALTNSLQQQNLRLNSVNFTQSAAFSNDMTGGGNSQQRSFVPQPATAYGERPPETPGNEVIEAREGSAPLWVGTSFSILA